MTTENQKEDNMDSIIWQVAETLRGPFKQSEYGRIILPFTVLRRLECVLEPMRSVIAKEYKANNKMSDIVLDEILKDKTGLSFYNKTEHRLDNLGTADAYQNLSDYIAGFNPELVDVFERFEFNKWIGKLIESDLFHHVVNKFNTYNLGPEKFDNHDMGTMFEKLIRRFAESANDTAGEYFTPRDVVELATELTFANADSVFTTAEPITIYDPTVGAGGFLTVGFDALKSKGRDQDVGLYGQELNGESYAICKADMIIRGHSPDNIKLGNTLTNDLIADKKFDFVLSNPPYGVDWKKIKEPIDAEHKLGYAGRFGAGLPSINDGSMLFMQHVISKLDKDKGVAGIILSGSPLFSGGAGGGASEVRRWLMENDYVDAIVALPSNLFYNTSISTYCWILSKNKCKERKGKVILINAVEDYEPMRKSLGDKRRKISENQRNEIVKAYMKYTDSKNSKIFKTTDFGFRRITVERPLQLRFSPTNINSIESLLAEKSFITWANKSDVSLDFFRKALENMDEIYLSEEKLLKDFKEKLPKINISAPVIKLCRKHFGCHDETAEYILDAKGNPEPNTNLRDYENIPLGQDIYEYFDAEVKPHIPNAWIDEKKIDHKDGLVGDVGYEISFNRYFYEYQSPRPLQDIDAELSELTAEIQSLLTG